MLQKKCVKKNKNEMFFFFLWKGYARDAAGVAAAGITKAKQMNDDVVLIDTAGRMQNNEPLMRGLVSLIQRNNPDLVLFVGEALVGNDGIDQLLQFNHCLQKLSSVQNPRLIDGIILTKFDTVDDKVIFLQFLFLQIHVISDKSHK